MSWTSPADLRVQVQKLWDSGALLAACVDAVLLGDATPGYAAMDDAALGDPAPDIALPESASSTQLKFPKRLRLHGPISEELSSQFDAAKTWVAQLLGGAAHLRIVQREFRHRVLGVNSVPDEVWLDTLDDALALLGKKKEARWFAQQVQITRLDHAALIPWLKKRPLTVLALGDNWPRLLQVVAWLCEHPRPGIYLRQVDIPGIDSKFIEQHRSVLAQLLDLSLPPQAIELEATGVAQFCQRYGFRDKPLRIRFRVLDPTWDNFSTAQGGNVAGGVAKLGAQELVMRELDVRELDVQVTQAAFAALALQPARVFITENEVNFLAFPPVPQSLVIFGSGYGFDALASAKWLQACPVHYWGDIDTHGFAILDQLRAQLPHAQSFLMDRRTLMAHAAHWGVEPEPQLRDLQRLSPDEQALLDDLRQHRLQNKLRLEQERIAYGWVQQALMELGCFETFFSGG
jgi:hypothetical protein